MSGHSIVDVGIYAPTSPSQAYKARPKSKIPRLSYWNPTFLPDINIKYPRNRFTPPGFAPIGCRPLPPTPFNDITNRNHCGSSNSDNPTQSVAQLNGPSLHCDNLLGPTINTTAPTHNHDNPPQYPPGLGWESASSPPGFYTMYREGEHLPNDLDTGVNSNSNSLVARIFKYLPSVSRFDPFRDEDVDIGRPLHLPSSPPYNYLQLPSIWQLESPSDSPPLSEHGPQGLPNIQESVASAHIQVSGSSFAPLFPPVPSNHVKSRVLNALKARSPNDRPSFSRFNPFGDEPSSVDASVSQLYTKSQADLKVPFVSFNPVQPTNVPDDAVLATLQRPLAPVHFVELSSDSSESSESSGTSSPVSDSECPVLPNSSDFALPRIQTPAAVSTLAHLPPNAPSIKVPGPFMVVKELSSGSFGQAVAVCELGDSAKRPGLFCLKVFRKKALLASRTYGGIDTEINAYKRLAEVPPVKEFIFLMKLDAALQDESHLYLAMDLMQCDLATSINYQTQREHAARWLAQIGTGIAALHEIGIVHRDIKPENVFIDWRNNVRLGDFGFAYVHDRRVSMAPLGSCVYGCVGTMGFFAPEMMDYNGEKAYSSAVDFWSFGCLAFELLNCDQAINYLFEKPETLDQYKEAHKADGHGRGFLNRFKELGAEAIDLISGLLELDPEKRFGIDELRSHRYFNTRYGNHFRGIEAKALKQHSGEISLDGDSFRSDLPSQFVPVIDDRRHAEFAGFDWINPTCPWARQKI